MNNTINMLFIYNTDLPSMNGLTKYAKTLCKKYGKDYYCVDSFHLDELKKENFFQIRGRDYDDLFLMGTFTNEDLYWPITRQRPRFKEVNNHYE